MKYIVTIEQVEEEQPAKLTALEGIALMWVVLIRMALGLGVVVLILCLISLG